jgi:glycine betaine/proline transport system substrate-binding protein
MKKILASLAMLLALATVAAACGDDDDTTAGDTTAGDESADDAAAGGDDAADAADGAAGGAGEDTTQETITLVVNPWSASRLNAEVAKNIIESELGNPVEITEVNENDAMFTGMADGSLDAVLEIWPSGVTDAENAYFDDGSVVNIGELGAIGKIGWFTPSYVIDEHPELATWEGYTAPEAAALFATAETGDQGRFLGTDPSYSQYDEQIIANLDLPFQVQFSGSEPATVAELDARVSAGEPILMYWWSPTAAVAKYDLVNVTLPAYNEECGASAAAADGGVDCDYPEDVLFKAASAQLEAKDPEVFAFLSNFTITIDDQLEMLPSFEIDGEDPAAVAAAWVDAHADTWQAWLG